MQAWLGPPARFCSSPMCGNHWSRMHCATRWPVWAIRRWAALPVMASPFPSLYWRFGKWLRDKLTAVDSLLVATRCVYVLRRELARPLPVRV
jgi:hypothetical protein